MTMKRLSLFSQKCYDNRKQAIFSTGVFVVLQDFVRSIVHLWNNLIEPSESVQGDERRQESRVVAGLLLTIALLVGTINPVRYLTDITPQTPMRLLAVAIGVAAVLVAYGFARRGHNRTAVGIVIVLASLLILVTAAALKPDVGLTTLYYLVVISVFASLFLTLRVAALIAGGIIGGMLLLPILAPAYDVKVIAQGPVSFGVILSLLVLAFGWYRAQLESKRQQVVMRNESRYRAISELISDYAVAFRVDPDGQLTEDWITGAYSSVTGYEWGEVPRSDLYHAEDVERSREDVKRVLRGETVVSEYRIITKDGEQRWVRMTRRPIWSTTEKRVVYFYAVAQDITQHREAEEQKLHMAVEQGRLGVVGDFVQAVSHDFRTSLATIETNRYLIEKTFNSVNPLKTVERLGIIQHSVGHLTQQIENLHTLSALISPRTEMSVMNKMVNDLIIQQIPAAQQKQISLTFAPEPYLSPVLADIGEVQRAINHLLLNAVAYTPENGKVNVRTFQTNKMVSVEIRDSGIGIDPDDVDHIFDFFYRADSSRSLETGGVGLGLSMVRMIAEAHNGSVTVSSTPGQGSVFTFSLPALPVESRVAS
jgi:PAS domain S-box-containing protein